MLEKYEIQEHVLFPKNDMSNSNKLESACFLYSMFGILSANQKSLYTYFFDSIKSLLDEMSEKEDRCVYYWG